MSKKEEQTRLARISDVGEGSVTYFDLGTRQSNGKTETSKDDATRRRPWKAFLFPHPIESAGKLFSDRWWKVYKRAVLLSLAAAGIMLWHVPKVNPPTPPPNPYTPPYEAPTVTTPTDPPAQPRLPYLPTSPFPDQNKQ